MDGHGWAWDVSRRQGVQGVRASGLLPSCPGGFDVGCFRFAQKGVGV